MAGSQRLTNFTLLTDRYAPSPTGRLHLGNLRTAVSAQAHARAQGGRFIVRIEDTGRQRSHPEHEAQQSADLEAIGIDWNGAPVRQPEHSDLYESALADLTQRGLIYPCFCTHREILAVSPAPHGASGQYPGTCRSPDNEHLVAKKAESAAAGRRPSIRLRSQVSERATTDELRGEITAPTDDFILQRAGGMWAYNLAVAADDAEQGVTEVVRGDDLMFSVSRQVYLAGLLGNATPSLVHVPLVVNSEGWRLFKRDGDVTLGEVPVGAAQRRILDLLGGGNGSDGGGSAELDSIADLPEALCAGLEIPREQVILQGPLRYPRGMPTLLAVHRSPTPFLQEVLDHALEDANDPALEGVDVEIVEALDAIIDDLTSADTVPLGTPASFGYISGAFKHFLDTTFREAQEVTKGLSFSYWTRGGFDITGAESVMKTITIGYEWEFVAEPVMFAGSLDDDIPDRPVNLGGTMATQILG